MCKVIDIKTRKVVAESMTIEEAQAIVGGDQMIDELHSTQNLCADDEKIVEACGVLINALKTA